MNHVSDSEETKSSDRGELHIWNSWGSERLWEVSCEAIIMIIARPPAPQEHPPTWIVSGGTCAVSCLLGPALRGTV